MTDARQQTGRFWLCPACHKHVPARADACACGFDRTMVPTHQREVNARPEAEAARESGDAWTWVAALLLAVVASYGAVKMSETQRAANDIERQKLTERRAEREAMERRAAQPPTIVVVQQPTASGVPTQAQPLPAIAAPAIVAPQPSEAPRMVAVQSARADDGEEAARQQQELTWRQRAMAVESRANTAGAAYVAALCKERSAGIAIGGVRPLADYRENYSAALNDIEPLQELARRAGASPGWVAIRLQYPAPLPADTIIATASNNDLAGFHCEASR